LRKAKISKYAVSILSGALLFLTFHLFAQDTIQVSNSFHPLPDSTLLLKKENAVHAKHATDSLNNPGDTVSETSNPKWIPQPQRATILSAVLPGLGQAYNRKYWKIPIIYTTGGVLYYLYYINDNKYRTNKHLYEEEGLKESAANTSLKQDYLNKLQDYDRKRTYKLILMGVLYIANVVDAMADAYFVTYDISDNLAFKVTPEIFTETCLTTNRITYGFTLSLHF
jgi:hypothetical protein